MMANQDFDLFLKDINLLIMEEKARYYQIMRILPFIGSIMAMFVGATVLVGWILNIDFLKSLSPDYIAMKPNSGLSFILLGVALYILLMEESGKFNRWLRSISHLFSFIVVVISSLTLFELFFGYDFGIDQFIRSEPVGTVGTLYPGRMTILAAIDFLLISTSLLFLNFNLKGYQILRILPFIAGLLASIDLMGYNYGIKPLYGYFYNQMAIHTAVTFIALSMGILCIRPDRGILRILASESYGGIMMRRLIVGAIIIPTVVGWFFVQALEIGVIDFRFAMTLFGVTGISVLILVIWWNARSLDLMDMRRKDAEENMRRRELQYRTLITEMSEGVLQTDLNETIVLVNGQFCKMLDYTESELIGKDVELLFAADDRDAIISKTSLRLKGISDRYETKMIKKSGESIWVSVSGAPVINIEELITGSVAIVADISEQKRIHLLNDAVYKIARASHSSRQLEDLFIAVHHVIQDVMPANNFYISLYDQEKDLISFPYFVDEVDTAEPPRKPGRGLTEYVLRTGKSLLCDERISDLLMNQGEAVVVGALSPIWLGVPLMIDETAIGVMVVQHYTNPRAYGEREKKMLEFVSDQVAKVIAYKKAEIELIESEERFRNLYDNVPIGIYRTSVDGKILNANPALINMLGYKTFEELSLNNVSQKYDLTESREQFKLIIEELGSVQGRESSWKKSDGTVIHVSENAIGVRGKDNTIAYFEGMVEDITERKHVEEERERLINELQAALLEVKTLSGLMPICASCKKIRDDTGYWNQLESYIETRSTVQFSHGICPECMENLYPDYYQRIKVEKKKDEENKIVN